MKKKKVVKKVIVKKKKVKPLRWNVGEGELIGYKKIYYRRGFALTSLIVTLKIPARASVINSEGYRFSKCRTSEAKVISIKKMNGEDVDKKIVCFSFYDEEFIYKTGRIVKPKKKFNTNKFSTCESGIHFYLTKTRARNH